MTTPMINVHPENKPVFEDMEIKAGTRLLTRDGTKFGNAIVAAHRGDGFGAEIYLVIEDYGNVSSMTQSQIEDHFVIGETEVLIDHLNHKADMMTQVMSGFADIFMRQAKEMGAES